MAPRHKPARPSITARPGARLGKPGRRRLRPPPDPDRCRRQPCLRRKTGNAAAAGRPEEGDPDDTFVDLYVADVAVPAIGRSLLGDGYDRLAARLKPGQQALVVAGTGRWLLHGAAYVRVVTFDRIEPIQRPTAFVSEIATTRGLEALPPKAFDFPEIAFVVPPEFNFDPTEPWLLHCWCSAWWALGKGLGHVRSRIYAARHLHEARAGKNRWRSSQPRRHGKERRAILRLRPRQPLPRDTAASRLKTNRYG